MSHITHQNFYKIKHKLFLKPFYKKTLATIPAIVNSNKLFPAVEANLNTKRLDSPQFPNQSLTDAGTGTVPNIRRRRFLSDRRRNATSKVPRSGTSVCGGPFRLRWHASSGSAAPGSAETGPVASPIPDSWARHTASGGTGWIFREITTATHRKNLNLYRRDHSKTLFCFRFAKRD